MPLFRSSACGLILLCLLPLGLGGCKKQQKEAQISVSVRDAKVPPPVEKPARELLATQQAFSEVSKKVTPVVVNIQAARIRRAPDLGPLFEDFFGELFKGYPPAERQTKSLGSGVIISADGYILTNEHVIKGAEEIKVKLTDERVFDGKLIGSDPKTDVAVLKIEPTDDLPVAVLGDSDALQVGQWALAIGNPFGLDSTMTVGVISATGRTNIGIEDFEDFIQTDASINPGNSGGPLLNIYGEVVGINTAIVASGQGIGFAIPINLARLIADQLIEKGEVIRGWLGVSIQTLSPALARSFGLDRATGALVTQVLPGSPAAQAGIRQGDILLTFNGREIRGVRSLQLLVANTPSGRQADLELLRDGKKLAVKVTITTESEESPRVGVETGKASGLGLTVVPAEGGQGVEVESVDPQGVTASTGIRPGDLILSLNRQEISDLASFKQAIARNKDAGYVRLLIKRGNTRLYLAFPVS